MEVRDDLRRALLDADIALLLSRFCDDLAPGVEDPNALQFAERLWAWQGEAGLAFAEIARQVRLVRGNPGYQREAAQFSRKQAMRKFGVDQFHLGIATRSRRLLDRWGWALAVYLRDLERFAAAESIRQSNVQLLQPAKSTILRARKAGLRVIDALSVEIMRKARSPQTMPESWAPIRRHSLDRIAETIEPTRQFIATGMALLGQRDDIKASIPAHLASRDDVSWISSIPSLRQQVAAYHAVLEQDRIIEENKARQQLLMEFDRELKEALPNRHVVAKADLLGSLVSTGNFDGAANRRGSDD